jgi:hypothetical protein
MYPEKMKKEMETEKFFKKEREKFFEKEDFGRIRGNAR